MKTERFKVAARCFSQIERLNCAAKIVQEWGIHNEDTRGLQGFACAKKPREPSPGRTGHEKATGHFSGKIKRKSKARNLDLKGRYRGRPPHTGPSTTPKDPNCCKGFS